MDDVRARLESIAEELGDMALDRLRQAAEDVSPDLVDRAHLMAEERRISRARRAVEKAVALLDDRSTVEE